MHRVLYIGDPHARPDCLDEMQKLIEFIVKVAQTEDVMHVVFLGDQFHTHSVIHLSVLAFWQRAFSGVAAAIPGKVFALVGNHDMSGRQGDTNNALMLFDSKHVTVVDKPVVAPWGALMVPYYADHSEFVRVCNEYSKHKLLICHQTFDGSTYENGFYAKDGIDPNLIPQTWIISGHIHTPQKVADHRIWYPGSPRWQTVSDANVDRAIWIVDHVEDDIIGSSTRALSTAGVCRPIYALVDREDEPVQLPTGEADIIVDVFGSEAYVRGRAEELEAAGVRVRQFPTSTRVMKVKESDGLPTSFKKFIDQHQPKFGTPKEQLLKLAESRISWMKTAG